MLSRAGGNNMKRRDFITLIFMTAWPLASRAQQLGKVFRVGLLATGGAIGGGDERRKAILEVLATHGFVEGRNLVFEARWGDGRYDKLSEYAAALKASKVDVIITFGYPAALAAKMSAKDVPVVVSGAGDPVATGLVQSLARPGGNLTGTTELATELSAKRLEILKEVVPNLRKVAMLFNAADHGMTLRYRSAEAAAQILNVNVQTLGVREPNDFEDAFTEMTRSRPDAILMVSDALTILNRKKIIEFAAANKLPAIFEFSFLVRDGGLMSYGPNLAAIGARMGDFVARILSGARPADLPLEQPTQFELVVNLKTAKSLGLTMPPAMLARADEVIE
jgi:putative ABC transport system substrate-binding protein